MAGAIPIQLKDAETEMIRSLSGARLSLFMECLDELGWVAARELLPLLAELQQNENLGGKS